jgi:hypothetical protein
MKNFRASLTDLNIDECNIILAGIGKLPLEASLNVFGKLKNQIETQAKEYQDAQQSAHQLAANNDIRVDLPAA